MSCRQACNSQLRAARSLEFDHAFNWSAPGCRWQLDELGRRRYRRGINRRHVLGVARVFAASGAPCLERVVTDRQRLRCAARGSPHGAERAAPPVPKVPPESACPVVESAAIRRTARSHAGVPLPCLPLFDAPSPSPPSFQKTRESTLTNGLRAVTQACRKDPFLQPMNYAEQKLRAASESDRSSGPSDFLPPWCGPLGVFILMPAVNAPIRSERNMVGFRISVTGPQSGE